MLLLAGRSGLAACLWCQNHLHRSLGKRSEIGVVRYSATYPVRMHHGGTSFDCLGRTPYRIGQMYYVPDLPILPPGLLQFRVAATSSAVGNHSFPRVGYVLGVSKIVEYVDLLGEMRVGIRTRRVVRLDMGRGENFGGCRTGVLQDGEGNRIGGLAVSVLGRGYHPNAYRLVYHGGNPRPQHASSAVRVYGLRYEELLAGHQTVAPGSSRGYLKGEVVIERQIGLRQFESSFALQGSAGNREGYVHKLLVLASVARRMKLQGKLGRSHVYGFGEPYLHVVGSGPVVGRSVFVGKQIAQVYGPSLRRSRPVYVRYLPSGPSIVSIQSKDQYRLLFKIQGFEQQGVASGIVFRQKQPSRLVDRFLESGIGSEPYVGGACLELVVAVQSIRVPVAVVQELLHFRWLGQRQSLEVDVDEASSGHRRIHPRPNIFPSAATMSQSLAIGQVGRRGGRHSEGSELVVGRLPA